MGHDCEEIILWCRTHCMSPFLRHGMCRYRHLLALVRMMIMGCLFRRISFDIGKYRSLTNNAKRGRWRLSKHPSADSRNRYAVADHFEQASSMLPQKAIRRRNEWGWKHYFIDSRSVIELKRLRAPAFVIFELRYEGITNFHSTLELPWVLWYAIIS